MKLVSLLALQIFLAICNKRTLHSVEIMFVAIHPHRPSYFRLQTTSNFHRFKIIDDPTCLCKNSPQITDHLLWECELLRKQRQVLKNSMMKVGGKWPLANFDLTNKHTIFSNVCEHTKF
jgi:hypothetical protein